MLALVSLLLGVTQAPVAQQMVSYETVDGFEIVALYFEPDSASSRAILLLPAPEEGKEAWSRVADRIAAAGFHILIPDPRGTGESRMQRGLRRDRAGFTAREAAAADLDGVAGIRYLLGLQTTEIRAIGLIGSRSGAVAAAEAIGYLSEPLGCLLISPRGSRSPWPDMAGQPVLVLVGMDDLLGIEAAGDLIGSSTGIESWIVDGRGSGIELLESRWDLTTQWMERFTR